MTDLNKIAEGYITAWNEADAGRRAELLKATFTEDVSYRDPLMQGDGHAGVAALIDGMQQRGAVSVRRVITHRNKDAAVVIDR